jgi:hypothetical protein
MRGATRWRDIAGLGSVRLGLVLTLLPLVHVRLPAVMVVLGLTALAQDALAKDGTARGQKKRPPEPPKSTTPKAPSADTALPRAVLDMIDQIQTAVQSGRIDDLATAVDWNEMKPDLGPTFVSDPVAHWKQTSKDGDGREILKVLGKLLASKPAVRPLGRDLENNRLFIWPSFADTPISQLSPAEMNAFVDLVPADLIGPMRDRDRYGGWRLVLGADGTWHSFRPD